ncbi:DUF58 domain-containing protein [Gemmatimonas phototrophica]|uniref:DUF58 domain-containing protein n=1 Tax=Gemmatimonas phototrophica TaxID=1379270 RepID=A0A143BH85_9BACT|nr:DUF58 domain-containing protein [Gemmatimonas phototrophica]AMW04416.1 hypothetical protein GEMMAAP_05325 [Gemmatimonas phototrophica]
MSAYGPMLDALRGVRWPARRAVGAAPAGTHRSTQKGTAGEFTEYRLYRQGDDPRALDWKLLARSDRAFVRLSDDRALLATWIVVDASASMAFPAEGAGRGRSKFTQAKYLAVGLAAVAHASADPVGIVVVHAGGVTRVPPRTRRGTVQELARVLDGVTCGGAAPLALALSPLPTNARIVLLTDCLGDVDACLKVAAAHGVAGALVECVHVVADEELAPPGGTHLARDPERADDARVLAPAGRLSYREQFDLFRSEMAQRWRSAGAGYTEVLTSTDAPKAVRAVVIGVAAPVLPSARGS